MNVLLQGIVGSKAYGLDHPGSDTDRMGVFQRPTADFLGLRSVQLSEVHQGRGHDDISLHEVGKFLNLALSCNPTASELLWLAPEGYETMTEAGAELIELGRGFWFAKGVRNSYLGYAHAQAKRCTREFATEQRREKAARHTWRLIHQGVGLWLTGVLEIRVSDRDACLDFGRRVDAGDLAALDELMSWAEDQFAKPTVLPDNNEPARAAADAWLRRLRIDAL